MKIRKAFSSFGSARNRFLTSKLPYKDNFSTKFSTFFYKNLRKIFFGDHAVKITLLKKSEIFLDDVDPCKRQPFRGRCPGKNGSQIRSQFVLRYYLRNGECVSYPYGNCFRKKRILSHKSHRDIRKANRNVLN
jgi:hypothetical protein